MSIDDPYYIWSWAAAYRSGEFFGDVDISEDGKKVVVTGRYA